MFSRWRSQQAGGFRETAGDVHALHGLATRALAADALSVAALIGGAVTTYLYVRSARPPVQAAITPVPAGAMADVRFEF